MNVPAIQLEWLVVERRLSRQEARPLTPKGESASTFRTPRRDVSMPRRTAFFAAPASRPRCRTTPHGGWGLCGTAAGTPNASVPESHAELRLTYGDTSARKVLALVPEGVGHLSPGQAQ